MSRKTGERRVREDARSRLRSARRLNASLREPPWTASVQTGHVDADPPLRRRHRGDPR